MTTSQPSHGHWAGCQSVLVCCFHIFRSFCHIHFMPPEPPASILLTFLQPGDLAVYKKAPRTDRRRPKKSSLFVPTEASFLLSCCTTHIKWMTEFRLENRKKGKIKKSACEKGSVNSGNTKLPSKIEVRHGIVIKTLLPGYIT